MRLPTNIQALIRRLEECGFEAYAVGGCVRDSLMGAVLHDYDICTSATPDEMKTAFFDKKVFETGLLHGTLTVLSDGEPVEITTFRTEDGYSDHRRPDRVRFVTSLSDDLARRDFTMNAIAYSERTGYCDVFGGISDIKSRTIRAVGNAEKRFEEDALRILRAVRFYSVLGFEIESDTESAMLAKRHLLAEISAERIASELTKLLCGNNVTDCLLRYRKIFEVFIPEISACVGFEQKNAHHCYDVWEHIARSVGFAPCEKPVRLTMLFHDIAKPACFTQDELGCGHFKGHPVLSADMARVILRRLKFDNATTSEVCGQILEHDNRFTCEERSVRRFLSKYGIDFFRRHIEVRRADTLAQSDYKRSEKLANLDQQLAIAEELFARGQCFSLKQLALNGRDLQALGVTDGKEIGRVLKFLLDEVIEGRCENTVVALKAHISENFGIF